MHNPLLQLPPEVTRIVMRTSSNGRTAASKSANEGSTPSVFAIFSTCYQQLVNKWFGLMWCLFIVQTWAVDNCAKIFFRPAKQGVK